MRKRLQTNALENGRTSHLIQSTQIILDDSYVPKAQEFIKVAISEIRICAYAWRWYENEPEIGIQKLNIDLLKKHRNGIKIKILVDTVSQKLLFKTLGFDVRCVEPTRMLHTKAICVDRKTLIIGSHNLTKRANSDNYEVSLATQEFEPVEQFVEYFDRMWASCASY